jgi:hypothetical protein
MSWTDSKLQWKPENYGNLTLIHVADHEVWQPDLTLYNSAGENFQWFLQKSQKILNFLAGSSIDHYGNTNCIVYNNGKVLWVPPSKFDTFCELDLKYWPFDKQTCQIIIGSWTYSGFQINLTTAEKPVEVSFYS